MAREKSFLVRGPDGRMSTIWAANFQNAVDRFVRSNKPKRGEFLEVKIRGEGEWRVYEVS